VLTGSLGLQGCTSTSAGPSGLYARPIGNAPVTNNSTPSTGSRECLGAYAAQSGMAPPSVAVGRISDLPGKLDDNGGRTITQGAMLMAIS
ncbi:transcriptional regulator, partial [Acinetobacter baumannii]